VSEARSPALTGIDLFSGLVLQAPLERVVLPLFRQRHAAEVRTTFEPTTILVELLRQGQHADVIIAVRETLAALADEGLVVTGTLTSIAVSGLAIAVPAGAAATPVADVPAFVRLLTGARSVAYSKTGASGIYFAGLLDRLGIRDQVDRTATIIPMGYTGECLLDGRADVAVQQLSELRSVAGITIAGPFPAAVQQYTIFAAAEVADAGRPGAARALAGSLRELLASPQARAAYAEAGLEPADPQTGCTPGSRNTG
jgi:molybdate transport system substrate-binding protein